ncbi:MAG: redoxin domain-containing protein, partial [Armatimonadetes bacterium]|nr:redoxin domain-containing protein [Armatimonadota bacterium]
MLKVGEPAPKFEAVNQDGKKVRLDDFKGKWLI